MSVITSTIRSTTRSASTTISTRPAVRDSRAADAFNQLLKLDSLASKLCGRAAKHLGARPWRQRLQEFEADHRRHTKYLAHLVYTVGGRPDWRYEDALASDPLAECGADRDILADVVSNKTIIKRRYESMCGYLEQLAPPAGLPEMREILRRNLQDHQLHLDWLATALQVLDDEATTAAPKPVSSDAIAAQTDNVERFG